MKKILTSSITDSAQLPILKRTIDHIQEMEMENIKSAIYASLGSSNDSVPIVLWGCVGTLSTVTVTNDTLTVTAGAFIYNGEIYQISAQSITKTGANVFTLSLDITTFQSGEPTIYSDGVTSVNTNQNLKIKLSQGLTGTGICDWDDRKFYTSYDSTFANIISSATPINCTIQQNNITVIKKGNIIYVNGSINGTSTNSALNSIYINLNLTSKYNILFDFYYPSVGINNVSNNTINGSCYRNTNTQHTVTIWNAVNSGNTFTILYSFTAIAVNIG
jgi:hypothetical protein